MNEIIINSYIKMQSLCHYTIGTYDMDGNFTIIKTFSDLDEANVYFREHFNEFNSDTVMPAFIRHIGVFNAEDIKIAFMKDPSSYLYEGNKYISIDISVANSSVSTFRN